MHTTKQEKLLILVVLITKCCKLSWSSNTPCGHEELVLCSRRLKPITESGFNFINNKKELDIICPDLKDGLECIRSYTRRCMDLRERDHYRKIYAGTNELIGDLCVEGKFQRDFLEHVPCMQKVKSEYQKCSDNYNIHMTRIQQQRAEQELKALAEASAKSTMPPATTTEKSPSKHFTVSSVKKKKVRRQHDNNDNEVKENTIAGRDSSHHQNASSTSSDNGNEQIKTVCCAFQEYMKCSEMAVKEGCGSATAEFTRNFLDKMLSSLMRMHCHEPDKLQCEGYSSDNGVAIHHHRSCCVVGIFVMLVLFMRIM